MDVCFILTWCSASKLFVFNAVSSFPVNVWKLAYCLCRWLQASDNSLVNAVLASDLFLLSVGAVFYFSLFIFVYCKMCFVYMGFESAAECNNNKILTMYRSMFSVQMLAEWLRVLGSCGRKRWEVVWRWSIDIFSLSSTSESVQCLREPAEQRHC